MTTPLHDPVFRELETPIGDRKVIFGFEIIDNKPMLTGRLKGLRSGWMLNLNDIALYMSKRPRESEFHSELPVTKK